MSSPAGAGRGPRSRTRTPDLEALAQLSGRITAMEPQQQDPHRRSIYIDGKYVLGLHEESIILAKLKVGLVVDGPRLVEALRQDQAKRAWDDALLMLSMAARTRQEVERRLARRYPAELAQQVVERLSDGGWLDDAAYARHYVEVHRDYGAARLVQDLTRRGVNSAAARQAVAEGLEGEDPVARAREAAAERLKRMPGVDRATAQRRLAGYLARRGYGFEAVTRALEPLLAELPQPPQRPARLGGGLSRGASRGAGGGLNRGSRSSLGRRVGLGYAPDASEPEE